MATQRRFGTTAGQMRAVAVLMLLVFAATLGAAAWMSSLRRGELWRVEHLSAEPDVDLPLRPITLDQWQTAAPVGWRAADADVLVKDALRFADPTGTGQELIIAPWRAWTPAASLESVVLALARLQPRAGEHVRYQTTYHVRTRQGVKVLSYWIGIAEATGTPGESEKRTLHELLLVTEDGRRHLALWWRAPLPSGQLRAEDVKAGGRILGSIAQQSEDQARRTATSEDLTARGLGFLDENHFPRTLLPRVADRTMDTAAPLELAGLPPALDAGEHAPGLRLLRLRRVPDFADIEALSPQVWLSDYLRQLENVDPPVGRVWSGELSLGKGDARYVAWRLRLAEPRRQGRPPGLVRTLSSIRLGTPEQGALLAEVLTESGDEVWGHDAVRLVLEKWKESGGSACATASEAVARGRRLAQLMPAAALGGPQGFSYSLTENYDQSQGFQVQWTRAEGQRFAGRAWVWLNPALEADYRWTASGPEGRYELTSERRQGGKTDQQRRQTLRDGRLIFANAGESIWEALAPEGFVWPVTEDVWPIASMVEMGLDRSPALVWLTSGWRSPSPRWVWLTPGRAGDSADWRVVMCPVVAVDADVVSYDAQGRWQWTRYWEHGADEAGPASFTATLACRARLLEQFPTMEQRLVRWEEDAGRKQKQGDAMAGDAGVVGGAGTDDGGAGGQ